MVWRFTSEETGYTQISESRPEVTCLDHDRLRRYCLYIRAHGELYLEANPGSVKVEKTVFGRGSPRQRKR